MSLPCHYLPPKKSTILNFKQEDCLVLSALELHVNWIIQYGLFCVWLFSLSYLRLTHIAACSRVVYFLIAHGVPLYEHTTVHLSILVYMAFWVASCFGIMKMATVESVTCPWMHICKHFYICYPLLFNQLYTLQRACYLTVSAGQESEPSLAKSSASESHTRWQSRYQPGLGSHLKSQLGKDLLSSFHCCSQNPVSGRLLDWGPQFLAGCWSKTIFNSLPHRPLENQSTQTKRSPASKTEVKFYVTSSQSHIPPQLLYSVV